ncbi:MAG: DUF4214 domain-containing protein [Burkholderiales bacterium]|nr:DUF4214 domain-containing protein [Burkholderiales bacterium]
MPPAAHASRVTVVLAAFALLFACLATPALAQLNSWTAAGPDYAGVIAVERDPADGQAIYAGTFYGGLYRSPDNGATWQFVPSPADGQSVQAIAFDATAPGTLYIGTLETGIFRSTDGGATWQSSSQGLEDLSISAIAVDPFDNARVLAATGVGPFVSRDRGATWQRLTTGATRYDVFTLAFDPARRGHIYVGTIANAVMRTRDDGATWERLAEGMGNYTVKSLRFDPRGDLLYAASFAVSFGRVFTLPLGGAATSWQDISHDLPQAIVNDIVLNPSNPDDVFALSDSGVYELQPDLPVRSWTIRGFFAGRTGTWDAAGAKFLVATLDRGILASTDAGISWTPGNRGLQNLFVAALATTVRAGQPGALAGTDVGVFVTPDRGATWSNGGGFIRTIFDIQVHPQNPDIAFAGTERNGVWKSTDAGVTWAPKSRGLVPPGVGVVAQAPAGAGTLYAGTAAGLFLSRDSGLTWQIATQVPIFDVRTIAFDPFRPDAVFVGTGDGKVHFSLDDGVSFFPAGPGLPASPIVGMAVTAVNAVFPVIYAVAEDGRLYVSDNDARTWREQPTGVTSPVLGVLTLPANPGTLYIATGGDGVRRSDDLGASWTAANAGLGSPFVFSLVASGSGTRLYAASLGAIHRSSDGGATWTNASTGLGPGSVTRIVADTARDGVLYALVQGQGLVKTANGGDTWTMLPAAPAPATILSLGINPGTPSQLYLGTALEGVYSSTDAGATFGTMNDGLTLFVRGIAIDPVNPTVMYAASLFGGVFKSTDGGENWRSAGLVNRVIHKVRLDPSDRNTVYAATAGGVARSRDGAATWTLLGQRTAFISSLLFQADAGGGLLYVGGNNGGLYRSTDGGASFVGANVGLPAVNVMALARNGASGALYALMQGRGLFASSDDGASWRRILDPAFLGAEVTSFAIDATRGVLYVATAGSGVSVSRNDGGTWEFLSTGLDSFDVRHLALDPVSGSFLHAATAAGVYTLDTAIAGAVWRRTTGTIPGEPPVSLLLLDERRPGLVFAMTDAGLFRTIDGGARWEASGGGLGASRVNALMSDPCSIAVLYAGTNGDGIYKSTNGGISWTPVNVGLGAGEISALVPGAEPGTVFAGTVGSGVQKSTDAGALWRGNLQGTVLPVVHVLGLSARQPGLVFAGTGDFGIQRSLDGGQEWAVTNNGLADIEVFSLVVDPANPRVAYAGTRRSGVFRTVDGGDSWTQLPTEGLYSRFVVALAVDPLDHNLIYAGTEGGGVFRLRVEDPPAAAPNPPIAVAATAGNARATVSFQAPLFDGGAAITGYRVTASPGAITAGGTASPIEVTGLANGTAYTFTVVAENAAGTGRPSAASAPVAPSVTPASPFTLDVSIVPAAGGTVSSSPLGVACVASCAAVFPPATQVTLAATATPGQQFVSWTGCDSCSRNRCEVRMSSGRRVTAGFTLDAAGDFDGDGVPNGIEGLEGLDPFVKDNDIFGSGRLFAMQQYRDFLGREGDAAGIAYWADQVVTRAQTSGQVVSRFFSSTEFAEAVAPVVRLYFAYFLRVPDYDGLRHWVAQYKSGMTLQEISDAFAASPESLARYGALDDSAFVGLLYDNVLGRAPDATGLSFWTAQLATNAMTRGQLITTFSESAEYRAAIENEVFVTMIYLGMLRRAPDPAGFAFWVGYMDGGNSRLALIESTLAAPEYRLRFLPP